MEANKVLTADLLDLIFENKNKEYGAYNLRKTYNRRIIYALLITAGLAVLLFISFLVANSMEGQATGTFRIDDVVIEDIKQKTEEKKFEPPPPLVKKVEVKVAMEQYTPPKIVKDKDVDKKDIPPVVEDLQDKAISTFKQDGEKFTNGFIPKPIDDGKQVVVEEKKSKENENEIIDHVEIDAKFDGNWTKFLTRKLNANTPVENGAPAGSYTVMVQFVVSKDGSISDVKALTHHGYGMEEEAVRVIRNGPNWIPAIQNGRNVNAYRRQPVTFIVQMDE